MADKYIQYLIENLETLQRRVRKLELDAEQMEERLYEVELKSGVVKAKKKRLGGI